MHISRTCFFLLGFAALFVLSACNRTDEVHNIKKRINEIAQSSAPEEDFHGVPPQGIGGDPLLNRQKNRNVPPIKIENYSVAQIATIPSQKLERTNDDTRKYWSDGVKAYVEKWENKGVVVEGYFVKSRMSGSESANGNSKTYRDIHTWITGERNVDKRTGIIAEITPRWAEKNPMWKSKTFEKLSVKRSHVRITGWLMWDEEHPDEVGKSRSSLWEIHPVTKIEVERDGQWVEFGK